MPLHLLPKLSEPPPPPTPVLDPDTVLFSGHSHTSAGWMCSYDVHGVWGTNVSTLFMMPWV